MDALSLLTTRRSSKKLTAPAPNAEQLEIMLQAATQVPDHGNMRPFRFTVIQSEAGLQRFRELLRQTVTEFGAGTFPDGLAFDEDGCAWNVSIVSNRLIRVTPDAIPSMS